MYALSARCLSVHISNFKIVNVLSFDNKVVFHVVPLWPNGEGIGLLSQGLWVQVPPGVECISFLCLFVNYRMCCHGNFLVLSCHALAVKYVCTVRTFVF